jgi:hypothetical protein
MVSKSCLTALYSCLLFRFQGLLEVAKVLERRFTLLAGISKRLPIFQLHRLIAVELGMAARLFWEISAKP